MDSRPQPQPQPPQQLPPVLYVCGDCGSESMIKEGSMFQCSNCHYRILYKKRTRQIVEFQAR